MSCHKQIAAGVGPLGYVVSRTTEPDTGIATSEQIKAQFRARGESVGQWADAHNFPRDVVYRVLNGRSPAWRGQPHQVAVALGLKPDPSKATA